MFFGFLLFFIRSGELEDRVRKTFLQANALVQSSSLNLTELGKYNIQKSVFYNLNTQEDGAAVFYYGDSLVYFDQVYVSFCRSSSFGGAFLILAPTFNLTKCFFSNCRCNEMGQFQYVDCDFLNLNYVTVLRCSPPDVNINQSTSCYLQINQSKLSNFNNSCSCVYSDCCGMYIIFQEAIHLSNFLFYNCSELMNNYGTLIIFGGGGSNDTISTIVFNNCGSGKYSSLDCNPTIFGFDSQDVTNLVLDKFLFHDCNFFSLFYLYVKDSSFFQATNISFCENDCVIESMLPNNSYNLQTTRYQ